MCTATSTYYIAYVWRTNEKWIESSKKWCNNAPRVPRNPGHGRLVCMMYVRVRNTFFPTCTSFDLAFWEDPKH